MLMGRRGWRVAGVGVGVGVGVDQVGAVRAENWTRDEEGTGSGGAAVNGVDADGTGERLGYSVCCRLGSSILLWLGRRL